MSRLFIQYQKLSLIRAAALEYSRTNKLTFALNTKFFEILNTASKAYRELGSGQDIDPRTLWVIDETGFSFKGGRFNALAKKATRQVQLISSSIQTHISILACVNATGYCLELAFVIKDGSVEYFKEKAIESKFIDPLVLKTSSGYINFQAYVDWIKYFVSKAKYGQSPGIRICDGLNAHTTNLEALQILNENKIICV